MVRNLADWFVLDRVVLRFVCVRSCLDVESHHGCSVQIEDFVCQLFG